jgi:membrane associated rhomboid family serine protease
VFIYPINRDQATTPSLVFIVLTVVNTLVLAMTYFADSKTVFMHYGFIPAHPSVATVFSSMFLHAGILHLLGNTWFFWMFGPRVENNLGRVPFLLLYLISGLGATGLHYAFNVTANVPCVGASGAISGVAAAYFVLFPRSVFDLGIYFPGYGGPVKTFQARTHVAIGAWIGEQFALALLSRFTKFFAIAFWGHVGGFAAGALFVLAVVAIRPREDDGLHFSVPTQIFLPVRNVNSMRRWYRKLGFVEAAMTQEDKGYGGVLALKAGGDGEPILFRHADVHDTPVTILINAEQPEKARTTLSYKGMPVSSIWWDKQGTPCFSLHDAEGNTIKFVKG